MCFNCIKYQPVKSLLQSQDYKRINKSRLRQGSVELNSARMENNAIGGSSDSPECGILSLEPDRQESPVIVQECGETPVADTNLKDNSDCNDLMPQTLEFSSDDSVSSTEMFFPEGGDSNGGAENSESTSPLAVAEESVAFGDSQFDNFAQLIDNVAVSSSCFSRSSLLVCDDSLDSVSKDTTSFSALIQSTSHEEISIETSPVTTVEETSLDSGLGSVESAGVSSEEENALSPDACFEPAFIHRPEEVGDDTKTEATQEKFYDCEPSIGNLPPASNKRPHGDWEDHDLRKKSKKEKRVTFCDVTVFYFPRRQGFVSVPSQGGSTLGMDLMHTDSHTMTLEEHKDDIKRKHKRQILQHMNEQKLENRIKQLRTLNPELDTATISSMATDQIRMAARSAGVPDDDDSILNNVDDFFFLQPIPAKKRREILRSSGVERIDGEEKLMNRLMRQSRELCGCSCTGLCLPESCECAIAGIQCQVDRDSFPCGCVVTGCRNPNGRIEFDSERVRFHTEATIKRLQCIEDGDDPDCSTFEKGLVSGSESECDVFSSDDAEHSESESIEFPGQFAATVSDSCVEYNNVTGSISCPEFPPNQHLWDYTPTPNRNNAEVVLSTTTEQNSYLIQEPEWTSNDLPQHEQVPEELLDALALKRIDHKVFYGNSDEQFEAQGTDAAAPAPPFYENCPDYFLEAVSDAQNRNYSITPSSDNMENFNPFSPDPRSNQSLFGTTLPRRESSPATRDCAVLLDPIATFMPNTYSTTSSGSLL